MAATTVVLLLFLLSVAIATAQSSVVATMRARTGQVRRWGGLVLIAVGLWLAVLAIWAERFARLFAV